MRILFLSARYPYPATRGDERRVLHLLEGLSRRAEVTLACFGNGPPLPFEGIRVESVGRRFGAGARENLRQRDPRLPLQVRLNLDAGMRDLVGELVEHWRPDVVHASLVRMAPYLPPLGTCHRHLDLIDALSVNMATRARSSHGPSSPLFTLESQLLRGAEARWAAAADSCSLVSEDDRRAAPGLACAAVVGNGVDTVALPFRGPRERPPTLLFFGNLGYFHNIQPARYVAHEVLPRVRERIPGAELRIAGARPARAVRELQSLEGVTVVGPVADMAAELHRAAVAVVPMFSGSGVKNKVLEAFCAGTPVVTNALGTQGIEGARAGCHYLGGERAGDLAIACIGLLDSPATRVALATRASELVRRDFTWESRVDALLELYGARPRPGAASRPVARHPREGSTRRRRASAPPSARR